MEAPSNLLPERFCQYIRLSYPHQLSRNCFADQRQAPAFGSNICSRRIFGKLPYNLPAPKTCGEGFHRLKGAAHRHFKGDLTNAETHVANDSEAY